MAAATDGWLFVGFLGNCGGLIVAGGKEDSFVDFKVEKLFETLLPLLVVVLVFIFALHVDLYIYLEKNRII